MCGMSLQISSEKPRTEKELLTLQRRKGRGGGVTQVRIIEWYHLETKLDVFSSSNICVQYQLSQQEKRQLKDNKEQQAQQVENSGLEGLEKIN